MVIVIVRSNGIYMATPVLYAAEIIAPIDLVVGRKNGFS